MKKKRYLITTINFGKQGDLSRNIIENLMDKKKDLSKITRRAIMAYFSNSKEYTESKINSLLSERKTLKEIIPEINEKLKKNEKQLNKLNYKVNGFE